MIDLRRLLAGVFLLLLANWVALYTIQELLYDFLIGSRGRRNALQIKRKAPLWQRYITMSYIRTYLRQDIKAFKRYYMFYIIYLWSILPQVLAVYYGDMNGIKVCEFLWFFHIGIAALISLIRRPWTGDNRSRYAYRRSKRKK